MTYSNTVMEIEHNWMNDMRDVPFQLLILMGGVEVEKRRDGI